MSTKKFTIFTQLHATKLVFKTKFYTFNNKNQFSSLQPQNDLRIVEVGLKSIEVNFNILKKLSLLIKQKLILSRKKFTIFSQRHATNNHSWLRNYFCPNRLFHETPKAKLFCTFCAHSHGRFSFKSLFTSKASKGLSSDSGSLIKVSTESLRLPR